jgi:hypothetical protein
MMKVAAKAMKAVMRPIAKCLEMFSQSLQKQRNYNLTAMYNIFENSKKLINKLNENLGGTSKEYWEEKGTEVQWNRNVLLPNGEYFDEYEEYLSIQESDINRLRRFQ